MSKFTVRLRVPVTANSRTRLRKKQRTTRRKLKGGFLPFLAPIIAAAIGAIPGIASVAVQASQKH